jgi:hypothetical protein
VITSGAADRLGDDDRSPQRRGRAGTAAMLGAAWQGFRAADGIARALAERGGWAEEPPSLGDRAQMALGTIGAAMGTARTRRGTCSKRKVETPKPVLSSAEQV